MRQLVPTAAANLGRPMPPRLSIDGNRFTLIDSAGNERPHNMLTLDIVIIDLNDNVSKMYWGKEYNPNDTGDIPLCWSDNGTAPSAQSQTPQAPKCLTCPHNVIGSAISKFTGAKIKACVDMKKVAFVIPGEDGIYLMTVKPGSFKNWSAYVNMLANQKSDKHPGGVELYEIVTQLAFESQGVLKFTAVGWTTDQRAALEAIYNRGTTPEIVGANDVPWTGQLAAPAQVQQIAAPVQQVQQPVPLAAPPAAQNTMPQTPGVSTAAQPSVIPAQPDGQRRKRRTKVEIEAANAAAAQALPAGVPSVFANPQPAPPAVFAPQGQQAPASPAPGQAADPLEIIPLFLRRDQGAAQSAAPGQPAAAAPATPSFGLATPAAADPGMMAAIEQAFKLPT